MCRITRQRHLIRQQRISNMNAPLASQEKHDFAKIENRAPSVAHMFLDHVARYPAYGSFPLPTGSQLGERELASGWANASTTSPAADRAGNRLGGSGRAHVVDAVRIGARRFRRDVRRRCDHHRLSDDKT